MAYSIDKLGLVPDLRVMVRNPQGKYLAQDSTGLFFTDDRSRAAIFGLRTDRVQEQLEIIREKEGVDLLVDPVAPDEIYETCERCKDFFMPFMVYFDGKRFLCDECRSARPAKRRST